jgi:uncharacterized UPF0146 family protein
VFFTPGWAAVLTLGGTLGGATLTQAVNSAISWRTTRKERKASITKAVSELIAGASAWVYATSSQEQDLFHAVATHVSEEKLMETLKSLRTDVYTAQLAFASAIASVRLTCPPEVVSAAEDVHKAVQGFEDITRAKGEVALRVRSVEAIEGTDPAGVVGPVDRLVDVTRRATGARKRHKG